MKKLFLTLLTLTLLVTAMATTAFAAETVKGDTLSISGVSDTIVLEGGTVLYDYEVGSTITITKDLDWFQLYYLDGYSDPQQIMFIDTYSSANLPIFTYDNLSVIMEESGQTYSMETFLWGLIDGTFDFETPFYIPAGSTFEVLMEDAYFVLVMIEDIETMNEVIATGNLSLLDTYTIHTVAAGTTTEEAVVEEVEEVVEEVTDETSFSDVAEEDAFYDAVLWAVEAGVTTGYADGTFRPDNTCTRGQVVTFLYRAMGSPDVTTTENPFSDVSEDSAFYDAILWAVENGITTGYDDGTFRPSETCTSAQVVTFLYRAVGEPATDFESELAASAATAYAPAIAWADSLTLLDGMDFVPSSASPRSDIVTYLYQVASAMGMA